MLWDTCYFYRLYWKKFLQTNLEENFVYEKACKDLGILCIGQIGANLGYFVLDF
jgi:hypothetical protein